MTRGTVTLASVESGALRGNPLGDPFVREVPVYLPPSYEQDRARRYPVLYCLAGFTGRGRSFLNVDPFIPTLPERLDAMIAGGRCGEVIVVFPDCMTRLGGSQYVNSSATGPYEDHVVGDLVRHVDAQFRTIPERDARAVLGKSSGGFGALWLAMRNPHVFGAAASHSGDMYFEYCYYPDFPKTIDLLRKAGGLEAWFRAFEAAPKKTGDHFHVLNIVAMAACYSPDPAAPLGIALPFDLQTGEVRPDVWERWLAFDPIRAARGHADALRSLKLLFIDCGTQDEFRLHHGARILARRLDELRIPYEREEFEDGHMQIPYRYEVSVPKVATAVGSVTV